MSLFASVCDCLVCDESVVTSTLRCCLLVDFGLTLCVCDCGAFVICFCDCDLL